MAATNYLRGMIQSDGKKIVIADCQCDATYCLAFPYLTHVESVLIQQVVTSGQNVWPVGSPALSGQTSTSGGTVIGFKLLSTSGTATSAGEISGQYFTVWAMGE